MTEVYLTRHDGVIEHIDPDSVSRFLYDTYWAVITTDPSVYGMWLKEAEEHVAGYKIYYKLPVHSRETQELLRGLSYAVNLLMKWDKRAAFKLLLDWLFLASVYTYREPDAIYTLRGENDGYRYLAVYFNYEYGERLKEIIERKIEDLKRGTQR